MTVQLRWCMAVLEPRRILPYPEPDLCISFSRLSLLRAFCSEQTLLQPYQKIVAVHFTLEVIIEGTHNRPSLLAATPSDVRFHSVQRRLCSRASRFDAAPKSDCNSDLLLGIFW